MKRYIAIYGGTELSPELSKFVEEISFSILKNIQGVKVVTGGYHYSADAPEAISTDYAAFIGAKSFAEKNDIHISKCFETWLPAPDKDRKAEQVVRFRGGKVQVMKGRSAQARRFEMVQRMDAILTIKGNKNTAMVLDFAIATGKPFFPLPFSGGDSKEYWKENGDLIKDRFGIDKTFARELKNIQLLTISPEQRDILIQKIIDKLEKGIQRNCLVLMSYRQQESNEFYKNHIGPVVWQAGFKPVNIKDEINQGNILSIFLSKLNTSDAIIADVTEANPNVMYELGQAHARGYPVILFCRKKLDAQYRDSLPFYLSMDKVENDDAGTPGGAENIAKRIKISLLKIIGKIHIGADNEMEFS